MILDTITIFKDDNSYIAVFVNGIKVYESNTGALNLAEITKYLKQGMIYFNNRVT